MLNRKKNKFEPHRGFKEGLMRKQFTYCEMSSFRYVLSLYVDGILQKKEVLWLDELNSRLNSLAADGWKRGYDRFAVKKAKKHYRKIRKKAIHERYETVPEGIG